MKLFDTLKNIWKIEELKTRILTTLGLILVYRLGTEVVLPGIDPAGLAALKQQTSIGVLGLLDMFSGGAFSNASIFALGIMPYISASIVVQLLGIAVPYFQRMQREGESGRRKINQITRYLTIIILILQGSAYLTTLLTNTRSQFGKECKRQTGDNTNHDNDRNTVSNTFICNFFTQPQNEHRARSQDNYGIDCKESPFYQKEFGLNLCMQVGKIRRTL